MGLDTQLTLTAGSRIKKRLLRYHLSDPYATVRPSDLETKPPQI